jgi:hypothetical protein
VARPAHSDIGSKLFCGDQHEQSVTAAARRTGYGGAPSRLLVRDVARHARARRRHASALAGLILALENGPTTLLGLAVACCAEKWLRRHLWMVDFNSLSPSDQAARIVIDNAMRIDSCCGPFLAELLVRGSDRACAGRRRGLRSRLGLRESPAADLRRPGGFVDEKEKAPEVPDTAGAKFMDRR